MWTSRSLLAGCAVLALSACAARVVPPGNRFVKGGEPAVDLGGPAPKIASGRVAVTPVPKSSLLPTIEGRDPALASALLRLAMHPDAEGHRQVAAAYRTAGVLDHAHRHLQQAVRLACYGPAYADLAKLWRDWRLPGRALSEAYRGLHCAPDSADLHNTLGTVLEMLGQREAAKRAFRRALEIDPAAAYALNNLCYVAVLDADPGAALNHCNGALAMDPTLASARNNLALAHALGGDIQAAERELLDGPDTAGALYNVGLLRLRLGSYSGAADAFDEAVTARPSFERAKRRAAQARFAAKELEDADR